MQTNIVLSTRCRIIFAYRLFFSLNIWIYVFAFFFCINMKVIVRFAHLKKGSYAVSQLEKNILVVRKILKTKSTPNMQNCEKVSLS